MTFLANLRQVARRMPTASPMGAVRWHRHFPRILPEDLELDVASIPDDVKGLMSVEQPNTLGFLDSYWYFRLRSEATILDPENLPKKSYKQLARDMGLDTIDEANSHFMGLIELYEYLKTAPLVGPFGTIENPVLIPSIRDWRVVGCTGGTGDNEHVPLWFHCREGFLYRCGECDQIFMLVRITYEMMKENPDIQLPDPDVNDVFDLKLLETGNRKWNNDMIRWNAGHVATKMMKTKLPDLITQEEFLNIMYGRRIRSINTSQQILPHHASKTQLPPK